MKKKIAFVMPQLGGGGAERVISTIINHLNQDKYEICLILIHDKGDYLENLPVNVKKIPLKAKKTRYSTFELLRVLRTLKPDIVFSSLRGLTLILSIIQPFLPENTKLIFREENTPSVAIKESKISFFWRIYYRTLFKKSDHIICQSEYMVNDFKTNFNLHGEKITRIYNPVDFKMIKRKAESEGSPYPKNEKKNVLIVSRMSPQKGIDILLKSISENSYKVKNIDFWIVGDGEHLDEYTNLAHDLSIDDRVNFVGRSDNPFVWMKYADLFVLPSRYEGLPNVLLEAIAAGCSTLVTLEHPGGTREIMDFVNRSEYVVDSLFWDNSWFNQDSKTVNREKISEIFDVKNVIPQYEKVFDEVGANNG